MYFIYLMQSFLLIQCNLRLCGFSEIPQFNSKEQLPARGFSHMFLSFLSREWFNTFPFLLFCLTLALLLWVDSKSKGSFSLPNLIGNYQTFFSYLSELIRLSGSEIRLKCSMGMESKTIFVSV